MIHKLLSLSRPLIIFDTETTGLDPKEARIVELGFEVWTSEGLSKSYRTLINPGISIPEEATKTHHITDAMVQACRICTKSKIDCSCLDNFKPWPYFKQLAPNMAKGFSEVDFCGQNVRYDLRIMSAEFARAGIDWSYIDARIIDSSRLEAIGEPRSLSHLYEKHTGQRLEGAHGALADVVAARMVVEAQLKKYVSTLPRDLDMLHSVQWPGFIDPDGKFKFIDGVACCTFGKWAGKPMKSIEISYFDWLIKNDFSEDVKALARNAKLGKFPEVRA